MAKKTHDQYVEEVKNINPNIEVIGIYINAKTLILHKCKIDDNEWMCSPSNILNGRGCPICANKNRSKNNSMTHEEYVKQLSIKNPTIEVVEMYINAKTKIMHHCLDHDIYWKISPDSVLNKKSGCPECKKEKFYNAMAKSRNNYIKELSVKNPVLELIGEYIKCNIPTKHYCKVHDFLFEIRPSEALEGQGCKYCRSDKLRIANLKTEEEYISELKNKNIPVKLIGEYYGSLIPTKHLCLTHNIIWEPKPANVLNNNGCPQCKSEKISKKILKSENDYIKELAIKNPDVILVGKYIGYNVKTEHYCKTHNESFLISPGSALKGCGCLYCKGSKGEKRIAKWLDKHNITYEPQKRFDDCKDINALPFDFYLPDYNIAIEYDGKQHFEPIEYFGGQKAFEYTQKHDNIKNEYCKNNNIKLLRISYFKNVEEELNNFLFI